MTGRPVEERAAEQDRATLVERLRRAGATLTPAERRLAGVIGRNYPLSAMGSIGELARAASVSPPSVARLAKKLGYDGFPALRAALKREVEAALETPLDKRARWAANAPDGHVLNRFAEAALANLRTSLSEVDPEAFDALAARVAKDERQVFVAGGRITGSIARYLHTLLRAIRPGATLLSQENWPQELLDLQEGDVVILFDVRRYERDLATLAALAAERGAAIALVTDPWRSPIARRSAWVFALRIEAPSAWDSALAPLLLSEALVAAVEEQRWPAAKARLGALETVFERAARFRR